MNATLVLQITEWLAVTPEAAYVTLPVPSRQSPQFHRADFWQLGGAIAITSRSGGGQR